MRVFYRFSALGLVLAAALGAPALAERGAGLGDRQGAGFFERMDADRNGEITRAEMDAARSDRFAQIDADGSGVVTAEEFKAHVAERAKSDRAASRIDRMIARYDQNGDGGLSLEEMPQPRGGDMFERLDADGDGVITEAEAEAARERMQARKGGRFGKGPRGSALENDG